MKDCFQHGSTSKSVCIRLPEVQPRKRGVQLVLNRALVLQHPIRDWNPCVSGLVEEEEHEAKQHAEYDGREPGHKVRGDEGCETAYQRPKEQTYTVWGMRRCGIGPWERAQITDQGRYLSSNNPPSDLVQKDPTDLPRSAKDLLSWEMQERVGQRLTCSPTVLAGPTPHPWKKRATIYPPYVWATAAPIHEMNAMKTPSIITGLRPNVFANGVQNSGDTARARAGIATEYWAIWT